MKIILRLHGSFLILIGIVLTTLAGIGTYYHSGLFEFLQHNEFAYIGLSQAYLLMTIIGLVLWIGSYSSNPRVWHIVGALAHVPPLAANIMFWHLFVEIEMTTMATGAMVLHGVLILVETTAFIFTGKTKAG
ncbi:MAG: hypothetical protein IIA45_05000 [Bacteroidetes bacterium]|nr:hypothetical protein [Bacteroidota bacterium]